MIGRKWPKHERSMTTLVSNLFDEATGRGRALVGILLNEVGSLSGPVNLDGQQNFDRMLRNSFAANGRGELQLYWSKSGYHGGV